MAHVQRREPLGLTPHHAFLRMASSAELSQYRDHPGIRVAGSTAFAEMKQYIADAHANVDVISSFEDSAGQIFDCIPIEQQVSLRGGGPLLTPPNLRGNGAQLGPRPPGAGSVQSAPRDRHGNPQQAPPGTIPVRRITLEELIRFEDMRTFFRKHPSSITTASARMTPSAPDPNSGLNHRYAVGFQQVNNIGAHGYISIDGPTVNASETFALAQHWYSAGSGADLQTVEVGWQVFPQKYKHSNPVLFIFWTSSDYKDGSGAYNLDSPGFVQVSASVAIGGALPLVENADGSQPELEITVYFDNDAWWIYIGNDALGYYPASLFGAGPMSLGADTIEFGGETVAGNPPSGDWGPMGTGVASTAGYPRAAYQRYIFYYTPSGDSEWANLTVNPNVSPCYSFSGGFDATDPTGWGTYFFFGGPGGGDC